MVMKHIQQLDKDVRLKFFNTRPHDVKMEVLELSNTYHYTLIHILDLMRFNGLSVSAIKDLAREAEERSSKAIYFSSDRYDLGTNEVER